MPRAWPGARIGTGRPHAKGGRCAEEPTVRAARIQAGGWLRKRRPARSRRSDAHGGDAIRGKIETARRAGSMDGIIREAGGPHPPCLDPEHPVDHTGTLLPDGTIGRCALVPQPVSASLAERIASPLPTCDRSAQNASSLPGARPSRERAASCTNYVMTQDRSETNARCVQNRRFPSRFSCYKHRDSIVFYVCIVIEGRSERFASGRIRERRDHGRRPRNHTGRRSARDLRIR